MVPFGHETSYMKLHPLADGGDQDREAVGGMLLTSVGDFGGPGQTNKKEQNQT